MVAAVASLSCVKKENAVNPVAPMWLHRPAWAIQLDFRHDLAPDQGVTAKTGIERGVPAIDARNGRVFVGTTDHGLYCVRAGDGSVIWRFQTAGSVQSEPLYDEARDIVYFGSDDDGMYALRARDGALLWRYRTGDVVERRPVLAKRPDGTEILVFVNGADSVFAVDPPTGIRRWTRVRTPALGFEIAGHAGIMVDNERVYAAFSTGRVAAYDLNTGVDRWPEVDISASGSVGADEQGKYFDVDTTPVAAFDHVFVASVATGVFSLDAASGATTWRRAEAEGVSWLTVFREPKHLDPQSKMEVPERALLIAGSGTTGLWALDPKNGDIRWRREVPRGAISYPVTLSGALLVTTSRLGMFLIDPREGRVIDGIDPGSGFAGGAAAHGSRAFVLTNAGTLLGLHVDSPTLRSTNSHAW
ncbi:MAG: hypothetical protein NVSMB1_12490 [Polyangiales bacterium]